DLTGADLRGVVFSKAKVANAKFNRARIDGADFTDADFSSENPTENSGSGAMPIGDKIYCGDENSDGTKAVTFGKDATVACMSEKADYERALVTALKDLFCTENSFEPPLSTSEAKVLLASLLRRLDFDTKLINQFKKAPSPRALFTKKLLADETCHGRKVLSEEVFRAELVREHKSD
ncbi:MAG: pentapeptide repeat-containing protein, partial [Geminicoccaceae bacterium]